mmetsp:Transcript_13566/g.24486  ORF Transcript_13566/g.24486 Transcript_13566/m.24486 type:complete len:91 (+) Transcript_13566:1060-1332(+)
MPQPLAVQRSTQALAKPLDSQIQNGKLYLGECGITVELASLAGRAQPENPDGTASGELHQEASSPCSDQGRQEHVGDHDGKISTFFVLEQ